ncbi:MAG: alanine--tRNA ligase [Nanoarchaeota archaeon]|nr:alanine--tRNA ligase [Nanoarchaeota archaeon]
MPNDKDVKREFKLEASKNYEKFYAVNVLKSEGFQRKKCACGTQFWTVNADQTTCGDPACSGGFRFFNGTPAKHKMDYIELWQEFAKFFQARGYTPIKRYPVVARWRDDTDFVQASIYDFQPYVVSGEVKPPANPLVVPQFCLRFNDIDNVGITGAHYTGFVMIGQHAFMPPEKWNQEKYFTDIHEWLTKGLMLPKKEITYHEDAWAGGGNLGPCMEYFSRGLELGNQVYMMYEQRGNVRKELNLKVLDMGMGHERNAWFTQGTSTSYETTFPTVCKKLFEKTGVKVNKSVIQKFLPYSSYLNVDEVESIDKTWQEVAKKIGMDTKELKEQILPLSAVFSVGEHLRSLLFALSDGALPSNVGGGYNLRVILRRALGFIDSYGWDVDVNDLCDWHASYLKPLFPELSENLENVKKILDVEKRKHAATREKTRQIVSKLLDKVITEEKLIELYDSNGILPDVVKEEASKAGKTVTIPDDFYAKVAERHEQQEQAHATNKAEQLDLKGIPGTKALYYEDYALLCSHGNVIKIIGKDVVLDQTVAYPTSGGQVNDKVWLNGQESEAIFKQGAVIVHRLKEAPKFKEGGAVEVKVDAALRKQLAQHHTATHVVGAAARSVLGSHINQAGAKKTEEKAHLDITHFEALTEEEVKRIEDCANGLVKKDYAISKKFYPRDEAEKEFGMRLYQGGAVPGNTIRVVNISGIDVQACGGTHLNRTGEIGKVRILKASKIQDGIVRLTFTAGKAAEQTSAGSEEIIKKAAELLGVDTDQVPGRAAEVFELWKKAKKLQKKGQKPAPGELDFKSAARSTGDLLEETAKALQAQKEHLLNTLSRFLREIEETKR